METELGNRLKNLREESKKSAKEVSAELSEMGFSVSDKTIYGYESGIRMPNADVFMAMCQIYNCTNILEIFKNIKVDYSVPDDHEWSIIEKYRTLDDYGTDMVDTVLEKEYERCQEQQDVMDLVARSKRKFSDDEKKQIIELIDRI